MGSNLSGVNWLRRYDAILKGRSEEGLPALQTWVHQGPEHATLQLFLPSPAPPRVAPAVEACPRVVPPLPVVGARRPRPAIAAPLIALPSQRTTMRGPIVPTFMPSPVAAVQVRPGPPSQAAKPPLALPLEAERPRIEAALRGALVEAFPFDSPAAPEVLVARDDESTDVEMDVEPRWSVDAREAVAFARLIELPAAEPSVEMVACASLDEPPAAELPVAELPVEIASTSIVACAPLLEVLVAARAVPTVAVTIFMPVVAARPAATQSTSSTSNVVQAFVCTPVPFQPTAPIDLTDPVDMPAIVASHDAPPPPASWLDPSEPIAQGKTPDPEPPPRRLAPILELTPPTFEPPRALISNPWARPPGIAEPIQVDGASRPRAASRAAKRVTRLLLLAAVPMGLGFAAKAGATTIANLASSSGGASPEPLQVATAVQPSLLLPVPRAPDALDTSPAHPAAPPVDPRAVVETRPAVGQLEIKAPERARVTVDGMDRGVGPSLSLSLAPGRHVVRVGADHTRVVDIRAEQTVDLDVSRP